MRTGEQARGTPWTTQAGSRRERWRTTGIFWRRLRPALWWTVALLLLRARGVAAATLAEDRILNYQVTDAESGALLYTITGWTEREADGAGRVAVASTFSFPHGGFFEERAVFDGGRPPRCLSWAWSIRDDDGIVMAFRQTTLEAEAFPFLRGPLPPDTYALYPMYALLGHVFTHLGLGRRPEASFHYPLMDTALLQMELWVHKREAVTVPAGEFDAYQVRMRPSVRSLYPNLPASARPFVSFFIPTSSFWLTVAEPQVLVKLSGTLGPPGSPHVVVQLTGDGATSQAAR